jgi:hypothetical protein
VVNGEGPFRHQDLNGRFLYSNNIQYYPSEHITLKVYADYAPNPDTGKETTDKSVISVFFGYKNDKIMAGGEYCYVSNYGWQKETDHYGFSVFGSYRIGKKFQALARYDYLQQQLPEETKNLDYYILGFQYEPVSRFTTSLNFRYYSQGSLPFIYANFGLQF